MLHHIFLFPALFVQLLLFGKEKEKQLICCCCNLLSLHPVRDVKETISVLACFLCGKLECFDADGT